MDQLEQVQAEVKGLKAALRLERLFHAQTKLGMWRARWERACTMMEVCKEQVNRREKESRRGG